MFIQDGHADFTGRDTFVNHTVPVVCLNGYEIHGDKVLTCGPTGQWSSGTTCRIKGTITSQYVRLVYCLLNMSSS